MTNFLVLVGVSAGSYLARILFVGLVPPSRLPTTVRDQLSHLGPAILGALTATALVRTVAPGGSVDPVAGLAVAAAAVVGWRTASMGKLLLTGMAVAVVGGALT